MLGRVIPALSLALLANACRQPALPSDTEVQRWALAWVAAWNNRSFDQLEGLLPERATYWSSMLPEAIPGRELPRHASFYWRLFPQGKLLLREVHRGPGAVAVEWWALPEGDEDKQRWAGVTWFRFRGGQPMEVRTYFDPTVLLPYLWQSPKSRSRNS